MNRQLRADIICVLSILLWFATSAAAGVSFSNPGNLDPSDLSSAEAADNFELSLAAPIYRFTCSGSLAFVNTGQSPCPGEEACNNGLNMGWVDVEQCATSGDLTFCVEKLAAHESMEMCYGANICDADEGVQWQQNGFDLADCTAPDGGDFMAEAQGLGVAPPPPPPPSNGPCDLNGLFACQLACTTDACVQGCDTQFSACFPTEVPTPVAAPTPSASHCNAYVLAVTGKCFIQ